MIKKAKTLFFRPFLLRVSSTAGLIAFMSARGQNDIQVISFPTSQEGEAFCSSLPAAAILLPSSYFEKKKNKKVVFYF